MKKLLLVILAVLLSVSAGFSTLDLNYIHYDPAIVASGDEVDIVVQYSAKDVPFDNTQIGDNDYKFEVKLVADDDMTRKYVTILDSEGDDVKGTVYSGDMYYKVFRVKVANNAPAANYEFKLVGQWYKNGAPLSVKEEMTFDMPVKKEGIILDVSSISTSPAQIRANDKFVEVKTFIENVGQKDAKSIEVQLVSPEGIKPSYSDNNRLWVGSLKAQESREVTFYLNLDEDLKSGAYDLNFSMNYMDLDDNTYSKNRVIPLLVKPKPYLEISKVEGKGLVGDSDQLKVWVKNVGEKSAEAVDVRIIKQNSQPFELDERSSYIGELEPGEEGLAVFDVKVLDSANVKSHDLKLLIRAKGDTDEGDDNIYTFNRRASYDVTGVGTNNNVLYGGLGFLAVIGLFTVNKIRGKKNGK